MIGAHNKDSTMNFIPTGFEGLVVIEPRVFSDNRGYFFESFVENQFKKNVADVAFVQENESRSVKGVVRGLHFQRPPHAQSKLVRAVVGRIKDVVVDLRTESSTYGKVFAIELDDQTHRQLFVPKGFAHGFSVLSDVAIVQYKCDTYYAPESEDGIAWNDPSLAIDWGIEASSVTLSAKDLNRTLLSEFTSPFTNSKL